MSAAFSCTLVFFPIFPFFLSPLFSSSFSPLYFSFSPFFPFTPQFFLFISLLPPFLLLISPFNFLYFPFSLFFHFSFLSLPFFPTFLLSSFPLFSHFHFPQSSPFSPLFCFSFPSPLFSPLFFSFPPSQELGTPISPFPHIPIIPLSPFTPYPPSLPHISPRPNNPHPSTHPTAPYPQQTHAPSTAAPCFIPPVSSLWDSAPFLWGSVPFLWGSVLLRAPNFPQIQKGGEQPQHVAAQLLSQRPQLHLCTLSVSPVGHRGA